MYCIGIGCPSVDKKMVNGSLSVPIHMCRDFLGREEDPKAIRQLGVPSFEKDLDTLATELNEEVTLRAVMAVGKFFGWGRLRLVFNSEHKISIPLNNVTQNT